ncbi:acyl carrier protein [Streptomyces sp. NPDC087300]|uniref:acyl carrier protein n=1 Tax=Streptomyces sp. NPDC087300 TaxID=3365780 RepID=UPI003805E8A9
MTTTAEGTVKEAIRDFLSQHTRRTWEDEQDIFAQGAVSSLFAMQLVVFLEKTFHVVIGGADLQLDNFRTVRTMSTLVSRLQEPAGGGDRG